MKKQEYELKINQQYLREKWDTNPDDKITLAEEGKCNNYNLRKNEGAPKYIVEGYTVSDFAIVVKGFMKTDSVLGLSTHFVIKEDGEIFQFVPTSHRAWDNGKGGLRYLSKLNFDIPEKILDNDMNSWAVGIRLVNDGKTPYSSAQIEANAHLVNYLTTEYKTIEHVIPYCAWTPGRHIAPGPYFSWATLANASTIYQDIDKNFGLFPFNETLKTLQKEPEILISYRDSKKQEMTQIAELQERFEEFGYQILDVEHTNEGILDDKTISAMDAFSIQYYGPNIVNNSKLNEAWEMLWKDSSNPDARGILGEWTENHDKILWDLLDQS